MTPQVRSRQFSLPLNSATGSILRCCWLVAALAFGGCSTPQSGPQRPLDAPTTPVVAPAVLPPAVAEAAPEETETKPSPAVSDDNKIFFASTSTLVDEAGKEKLRRVADNLKQDLKMHVTLAGYADDLGSRNYNLALTEERLSAVRNLLLTYGVSPRQIRRNRIGSVKRPKACTSPDCRQQMRRVEVVYSQ